MDQNCLTHFKFMISKETYKSNKMLNLLKPCHLRIKCTDVEEKNRRPFLLIYNQIFKTRNAILTGSKCR